MVMAIVATVLFTLLLWNRGQAMELGSILLDERADCATGVHIIAARASGEEPGGGTIGTVVGNVVEAISGSDSVAVDYPATVENYASSVAVGIKNMTELITSYVATCPDARIVLMGYSQVSVETGMAGGFSDDFRAQKFWEIL
jgi:hypothetical protein